MTRSGPAFASQNLTWPGSRQANTSKKPPRVPPFAARRRSKPGAASAADHGATPPGGDHLRRGPAVFRVSVSAARRDPACGRPPGLPAGRHQAGSAAVTEGDNSQGAIGRPLAADRPNICVRTAINALHGRTQNAQFCSAWCCEVHIADPRQSGAQLPGRIAREAGGAVGEPSAVAEPEVMNGATPRR